MNCAERLVSIFGSQAEVARAFQLDRAVVNNWVKSGYVPARWATEVERVTNGGITAVDEVDLTVAPGEVVGLIGHNGAGKTTLFDLLTGFQRPDGGTVLLDGEQQTADKVTDIAKSVLAAIG